MKIDTTMKMFNGMLRMTVKVLDFLSGIVPAMMMVNDWYPEMIHPIEYGISVLFGLISCLVAAFGVLLVTYAISFMFIEYTAISIAVSIVFGMFIGIGFLRKKIDGKLK